MATGKLPSSAVVRLPGGPLQARPDLTLAEWALLCRVDGRRPLAALANRSGRGQNEAVTLAERLLAAGLLELAGDAEAAASAQPAGPAEAAEAARDGAGEGEPTAEAGPDATVDGEPAAEAAPDAAEPDATVDGEPASRTEPAADGEPAGATALAEVPPEGGPADPGAADGGAEAASPGQARIDPVSLLRELAAEGVGEAVATDGPEAPEVPEDQSLAELAAQLAGVGQQAEQADPEAAEEAREGDEPTRAPGRGANQADIMREFASLAMGDEPAGDTGPAPQPDDESPDDERGRGRFGFRRGQRR